MYLFIGRIIVVGSTTLLDNFLHSTVVLEPALPLLLFAGSIVLLFFMHLILLFTPDISYMLAV